MYIIDEAEKMGIEAQNALLKTLEEPPEYAVLLLLTADAAKLLDTIRSRCRLLRPERIPEDTIRTFLIEEKGISPENAGLSAAFSGGNPGLAAELSESGEFRALYREAVTLLKNAASMDISELYEKAQSFVSEGVSLPELFSLLENWYRDVLLLKAGGSTGRLFFSGETAALQQISLRAKEETIGAVFEEIRKARQRISANVNKEMTLQFLFLKLREV